MGAWVGVCVCVCGETGDDMILCDGLVSAGVVGLATEAANCRKIANRSQGISGTCGGL